MLSAKARIAVRLVAVALLAAPAAGCFTPMYAEHADGSPALREKLMGVDIPELDKPKGSREARIGVEIRNALAFKLYGNATGMPPTHKLVLKFTTTRASLIVDPNTQLPSSENYGIDAQFNLIRPENVLKWSSLHPEPNHYDFTLADRYVEFGQKRHQLIVGHAVDETVLVIDSP